MPLITVLPPDLCNKIAAGEVIERPASVVKELVENSLDAGSTEIRIEIGHGGKRLIRVTDNGCGMDRDDALLCFSRHATSKISAFDDLYRLRTLGFRGEALPSIASVSKVRLLTALKGSNAGISIELHAGGQKEVRDAAASGTVIEIRDLFFNTPARKKFLKTDSTEIFHITDAVTKEALAHPETAFSLNIDNHENMLLPRASGFRERIMQIYGEEFLAGLAETTAAADGMSMQAFVSDSRNFRNTRSNQFIFINSRPVKDQSVSHAVYRAYEGILPQDRHPLYFLFLEIDPSKADFNVHPTKREVRFEDKEGIYRFVIVHLRDIIRQSHNEYVRDFGQPPVHAADQAVSEGAGPIYGAAAAFIPGQISENLEFSYRPSLPHIYLGDSFVALSGKGGLTIIDHHAAHERVLFERLLNEIKKDVVQLLLPRSVRLPAREYGILLSNSGMLAGFGIEIGDFGDNTLIVRTVPADLADADFQGLLSDIAAGFMDEKRAARPLQYEIAARIACHSSVRGRRLLSSEELSRLLEDLEKTENPDQCPHGRPTRIFYSLDDLSKLFKRK